MKTPLAFLSSVILAASIAKADALIHGQYLPYAGTGGGIGHYAMSYDSGETSKYIYVALHNMPIFPNPKEYVLRAYEMNTTTGQYSVMTPFATNGGALYTDANYIRVGLAKPGATVLQHFYYLSDLSLSGDRIGWATINSSTGKISPVAGVLTQGTGGVQGLQNAKGLLVTPSLTQSFVYTLGTSENVIGRFTRNMTTGALTYAGVTGPALSPNLDEPTSFALNSAGTRLAVVSNNTINPVENDRLTIFNINATTGDLTVAHDLSGECFNDMTDVVLSDNNNIVYVGTTGAVRRVVRSAVTFTWSCTEFAPAFWTDATVRIGPGRLNGHIIASISGNDLDSVAALDMSTAATVVLSDVYNTVSENYYLKPIAAQVTKDKQRVLVGNEGVLVNIEGVDGLNVFRFNDAIFRDGFED